MTKTDILHIRVTHVERLALDRMAEQEARTLSSLVRHRLKQLIAKADAEGSISLDEIREALQQEELPEARRTWGGG